MLTAILSPASLALVLMLRLVNAAARSSTMMASMEVCRAKRELRGRATPACPFNRAEAFIKSKSEDGMEISQRCDHPSSTCHAWFC